MSDIVKANAPTLRSAWLNMAMMDSVWTTGSGNFLIHVMMEHGWRDDAEHVALYWNQHGRDDIAARIKTIIHQGDVKIP